MQVVMYNYSDDVFKFLSPMTVDPLDNRTMPESDSHRNSDGYYITENISHGFVVDGPPVFYRINHDGFRSKHFNKFDDSLETVLFSGCSWTFGEGLPEQYIWPQLVVDKITKSGKLVDHYNIGYMGQSVNHIVKNIFAFIRNYGKPKHLLVCLPDIQRNIYYSPKLEQYIKAYVNTSCIGSKDKDRERYTKNYQAEDNLLVAVNSMLYLEDFCEASGINLVWTTWAYADYYAYSKIGFKKLMDPDTSFIQSNPSYNKSKTPYYPNPDNLPYWEDARDGAHPGTAWTHFISDKFYKAMEEGYREGH
jgi:hypothetical protein